MPIFFTCAISENKLTHRENKADENQFQNFSDCLLMSVMHVICFNRKIIIFQIGTSFYVYLER